MIDNGGLVLLFAWLIYFALLAVLGFVVLRHARGPLDAAHRNPENPANVP